MKQWISFALGDLLLGLKQRRLSIDPKVAIGDGAGVLQPGQGGGGRLIPSSLASSCEHSVSSQADICSNSKGLLFQGLLFH